MAESVPHVPNRLTRVVPVLLIALGASLCTATRGQQAGQSFADTVQPIFAKNCSGCHGTGMKGGLRLDSLDSVMKGGDSGVAVVPGEPDKSLLLKAVRYHDADLKMPPKGPLAEGDVAAIEAWIRRSGTELRPALAAVSAVPQVASAQEQYFESKVRPLLIAKCYGCHASQQSGGLRLDSRNGVMKGGKDGAVVDLGHPEESLLLKAVHYGDHGLQMPPSGQLMPAEVAVLEQWVRDGVAWPAEQPVVQVAKVTDKDRAWWAYRKPVAPEVPRTSSHWAYNDLDRFVQAKLDAEHLTPVRDADKRTMLRRVTYDLTGLPPAPEEVAAYVADRSPDAYARLVDRLLASKAYGERWGRVWLDVVRYSDTSGDGADYPVPEIYKYRDYVVESIAQDKPYDRFIREQIAGDLLPATTEQEHWRNVIATGYLANANHTEDPVSDAVDNIGYAYLGTTVACARCHDHKFDPLPTADYYAMYGILASSKFSQTGWEEVRYERNLVYRDPKVVESQPYKDFETQLKPVADSIAAVNTLPFFDDVLPALQARRMALFKNQPRFEAAYAVVEGTPHDENVQHLGDKKKLGEVVPRHFLQVVGNWQMPATTGSGRLEMANWIASPENPLTARVMVNRIWQGHFGRGIVPTPNDFGKRGMAPSDQPLLDYLATEFVRQGWSIKAMHRMMVLSHTYRLSSAESVANEKIDPENVYLWRHSRARMDAEAIRDTMLATSGTLDRTPAGAQPFPPQAEWNYSGHAPFHAVYETNRRTLYVMAQRTRRHPYLGLFDGANAMISVGQRDSSVTPLQALYFLNAAFPKQCADALAHKLQESYPSDKERIGAAFLSVYGRPADKVEIDHAVEFLAQVTAVYSAHAEDASAAPVHQRALSSFVQALYASNEFLFID